MIPLSNKTMTAENTALHLGHNASLAYLVRSLDGDRQPSHGVSKGPATLPIELWHRP